MRTNLDKWNHYQRILEAKFKKFISESLNEEIPDIVYRVYPSGKIDECIRFETGYSYHRHFKFSNYFSYKKPTKEDVKRIQTFVNQELEFDIKYITFEYQVKGNKKSLGYKSTFFLYDNERNKNVYIDKEYAEIKSKEFILAKEEEREWYDKHAKDTSYDYQSNGYKFLGWQNGWSHVYFDADGNLTEDRTKAKSFGYTPGKYPEYCTCRDAGHRRIEVRHNSRGSENTVSCPICKIYWKYDSSG